MGGLETRVVMRGFAAVMTALAIIWLALWYLIPAPPHELTIAAGGKGGGFEHLANRYKERLARHHVTLKIRFVSGGQHAAQLITDAKSSISAAFLYSGILNSENAPDIESLGRIDAAPLWIFYRGPQTLDRLSQLKGKRAFVTNGLRDLADRILAANGVKAGDLTVSPILAATPASQALQNGEIDVVILPPIDLNAPSVQTMLRDPNIRLMNVTQAEAITRLFPSLNRLVLPQGVIDLEKNIPPSDVNLLGSSSVVVVRKDLHPELKYLLAQVMKEEHSGGGVFQRPGEFPSLTDPDLPMAEEAVDYYRNGPSFLQRYLPFWMINYAKRVMAILIAAVAVIIPVFTYAPRLYDWLLHAHLNRLYRRLRAIDARLQKEMTATEATTVQNDLNNINLAAGILPVRQSTAFFLLRDHIDKTRALLDARLAALRA